MGLSMREAMIAFEFLKVGGHIEVERRTFELHNLTCDTALTAIVQMPYQAQAAKLGGYDIRRPTHNNVSSREIPGWHQRYSTLSRGHGCEGRINIIAAHKWNI